jgi:DNA-binding NarL/FixJ family response regulator
MKVLFFSADLNLVDEWKLKYSIKDSQTFYTIATLEQVVEALDEYIIVGDYDSLASEINTLISSNKVPKNFIVLERTPEIVTGKALISRKIKAYGNSRMLALHFNQMVQTVSKRKVWTYPELTSALSKEFHQQTIKKESLDLIEHRLSDKEIEVVFLILQGFINDAIASKLGITTRTVKAHITSIFSKLHVNDRLALVLLLK